MPRRRLVSLVGINLALLAALAAVVFVGRAGAQSGRERPRGDYTMVGARAQGIPESAVFIVDRTNQEMVVLRWDRSRKALKGLGFRDLAEDARRAGAAPAVGR